MGIPIPFGGILVMFGALGALVVGVALVASGVRSVPRNAQRVRAGQTLLGVTLALGILVVGAGALFGVEDWNPHPVLRGAIAGTWRDGADALALHEDSTYALTAPTRPLWGTSRSAGRWSLDDWNLQLVDSTSRRELSLRVVIAHGEYRIMPDPEDLDDWNGRLAYRRTPRSVAP